MDESIQVTVTTDMEMPVQSCDEDVMPSFGDERELKAECDRCPHVSTNGIELRIRIHGPRESVGERGLEWIFGCDIQDARDEGGETEDMEP